MPFLAADAISLISPDRFYDDLLKVSLGALFVAQLIVFVVYPRFRRGAVAIAAAAVASGLAAWGLYTLVAGDVVDLDATQAHSARACDRHRRRAVGRRRQGQDRRPARAALGPRVPLPGRAERRAHDRRRRRDVQDPRRSRAASLRGKTCVIGAGCVVDPQVFLDEVDELEARGYSTAGVVHALRQRAPDHAVAPRDRPGERAAARQARRSGRRGAASARATPTRRCGIGIRVQDLLDPKILRQKIEVALAEKNLWLERVYGERAARARGARGAVRGLRAAAPARTSPTRRCSSTRALQRRASTCCFEGAQGTLLDLDHGTYPFVTSSNTGRGERGDRRRHRAEPDRPRDRRREGVRHARRRGAVPVGDRGRRTRSACASSAREYGTVTGREPPLRLARPRRAPLRRARERHRPARADEARRALALRRAAGVRALPRCATATRREDFPAHQSDFHAAQPVYETLPGWDEPLDALRVGRRPAGRGAPLRRVRRARARRRGDARSAPAPSAKRVLTRA